MFQNEAAAATTRARTSSNSEKPSPLEEEVVGLFDQLHERLMHYLLSLGLPAAESEETVQETFLALFQHLQRGKPRYNLRGWVFQVAHNLALKQRKATQRNRQALVEHGWTSAENCLANRAPGPEEQFFSNQRQARFTSVLQALPEQDRRCLSLRAEGLTYREIAEVLEMSLGSVSLSLGRSLARFARADQR